MQHYQISPFSPVLQFFITTGSRRLRQLVVLSIGLSFCQLPAAAQEDGFFIFPREYWRLENEQRVVGDGGRLAIIETPEGEEIEVVEFSPSRSDQRQRDITLFTTAQPAPAPGKQKVEDQELLKRPLRGFNNGRWVETTFDQAGRIDRAIYRRDSAAFDGYVDGLYESAQLRQRLQALQWLAVQAQREGVIDEDDLKLAQSAQSYAAARQTLRGHAQRIELIDVGLHELSQFAGYHAAMAANDQARQAEEAKLQTLDARIAVLEQTMGDRAFDKQHPNWREKELARIEAYETRAEIHFLTRQNEELVRRMTAAIAWLGEIAAAHLAEPLPEELPDAAMVKTLTDALGAVRQAAREAQQKHPTPGEYLVHVAGHLDQRYEAKREGASGRAATMLGQWQELFPDGMAALVTAELQPLQEAVAEVQTIDYGTYRVTMLAQMQGIENCLGTPIRVTAGGVTRTFWPYDFPGSGLFGELSFLVDFAEPDAWLVAERKPNPVGSIPGLIRSYDQYNALRSRDWRFEGKTTLDALAHAVFGNAKTSADKAWTQLVLQRYQARGTFDISVTLGQTARYHKSRGMGGPDATIDGMVLDVFIVDPVAEPPILLRQALVQKNWFKPGEAQAFMAWMHNRTDAPQSGTLRTVVVSGIADELVVDERSVTLAPGSAARVVVPWQAPANHPLWGQEVRMELVLAGHELQAETDVFSIHPNTYAVMMHGGATGYQPYHITKTYQNHRETFSATFCDSAYVLPDDLLAPYVRSMSDVIGHVLASRAEAQRNRKIGVASVHYISPLVTGHKSIEMYRKHPEWFPERLMWTEAMTYNHRMVQKIGMEAFYSGDFEQALAVMGKDNPYPLLHLEQPINMANDLIFNNLVEDLITFSYAVPWDGARWDGGPMLVQSHDFLGRPIKHFETGEPLNTVELRKDVAFKRLRDLKLRVWEHHPEWVYGNNGDTFGYGGSLLTLDHPPPPIDDYPQYKEFMKDGGGYMDEGWMNAYIYSDNRNKVDAYLRIAFKQAHVMKEAGGYLQLFSPERDYRPLPDVDALYYTLLPHIAGCTYFGELSASPYSVDGPIYFFERFSEFFLNEKLRPLPEAATRVNVDLPDVWAPEASTIQALSADHVRVIVPILLKHPRERLYDSQSRYSVLPQIVERDFAVSVQAPDGFANVTPTAWEITCEPRTQATPLDVQMAGGNATVHLPGVKLFKVVVLEYRRNL